MRVPARSIAPGRASSTAIVSTAPFSFVGGADPTTGRILDATTGREGERFGGRVFAFPHGKGSTVGSYVLYGLVKRRRGPVAIVNARAETIVAVGAILGGIPMVDRVDVLGIRTGDRVVVDADRGFVDLPDVRAIPVVTAVLRHKGRILLLRRSPRVRAFGGWWSAVSGLLEGDEDPRARARREIREETGITHARLRSTAPPVIAREGATAYLVHPFLFDVPTARVRLDRENVESRWVRPDSLDKYRTVPRLRDVVLTLTA